MRRILLLSTFYFLLCVTAAFSSDHKVIIEDARDTDNNGNRAVQKFHDNGDGTFSPVTAPPIVTAGNDSTQTAATGSTWTALASHAAIQVTIVNTTGTSIDVRYGTGTAFTLPDGAGYTFRGLTNSSGLQVKRNDSSNTQVMVKWNWESW